MTIHLGQKYRSPTWASLKKAKYLLSPWLRHNFFNKLHLICERKIKSKFSEFNRGRCYATYSLESSAVSVSLSPTARHLLVGLAIRAGRITFSPADRSLMAQIFRIKLPWDRNAERGRLVHRRDIHQTHEQGQTSLNCIRWIPVAGQGIVYATNTGLLKIMR